MDAALQKPAKIPTLPEFADLFRRSASDEGLDLSARKLAARLVLLVVVLERLLRRIEVQKANAKDLQTLDVGMAEVFKRLAPLLELTGPPPTEEAGTGPQEGVEGSLAPEGAGAEPVPAADSQGSQAPTDPILAEQMDEIQKEGPRPGPLPPVPPVPTRRQGPIARRHRAPQNGSGGGGS